MNIYHDNQMRKHEELVGCYAVLLELVVIVLGILYIAEKVSELFQILK